jgi:hypothetical protein
MTVDQAIAKVERQYQYPTVGGHLPAQVSVQAVAMVSGTAAGDNLHYSWVPDELVPAEHRALRYGSRIRPAAGTRRPNRIDS